MIIVIINGYHIKNIVRNEQTLLQEGEKGFREKAMLRNFSCRDGISSTRHQAKEKGLKGTQVVCVFMTLNIQRG